MARTGRPTGYKPEYCAKVIKFMSEGRSLVQFAAHLDVCRDTIYDWANKHKDFSDALKKAKAKCQAWWEETGHRAMVNGDEKFNSTLYIYSMKARFQQYDRPANGVNPATPKADHSADYDAMYEDEKKESER